MDKPYFSFAGQDSREAAKWYQKSAELGNLYAQYRLGLLYEQGLAVPAD